MRCPTLKHLPSPPPHKTGWPWTEESFPLPDSMSNGQPWPRISIVTPSFNQGQFIEETIRSVLLQGYPDLEYIIIDGGSMDATREVIRRYEPWLTFWVSEPDGGQAEAINKGFARCTGELMGWLNSDDFLLPEALSRLGQAYNENQTAILIGEVIHFADSGTFVCLSRPSNVNFPNMVNVWLLYTSAAGWSQQGTYVPHSLYQQVGGVDETLRYVFDRDWMCRLLRVAPVCYLHQPVATFRKHDSSKTNAETPAWVAEEAKVTHRYRSQVESKLDWSLVEAGLDMYGALIHLSITSHWNRRLGWTYLSRAVGRNWQILGSTKALSLCARAMIPLSVLQMTKGIIRRPALPAKIAGVYAEK